MMYLSFLLIQLYKKSKLFFLLGHHANPPSLPAKPDLAAGEQGESMSSESPPPATKFFWGNAPEEDEYYASQGVVNRQSYFQSPHGRIFTQSFIPISGDDNTTATDIAATKGLVFMTHGYGSDSGWLFQKIAISYASWGYAVYCADLLGHGRSDGLRGYVGDMEKVADASLSFFLSVRRDFPLLPAFLFGESMGGAVTLLLYLRSVAGDSDPAWNGMIFSGPLFAFPPEMRPSRIWLFLFGLLFGAAEHWQAMPAKNMVVKAVKDPEKMKIVASNPRRYAGKPRVGTMRELARVVEYLQGRFWEVEAPFMVAHGTEDGLAAPEGAVMIYERAKSGDKTLRMYEGMYHSLIQGETDENSAAVLADMRRWIDERSEVRRCSPAPAPEKEVEEEKE